MRILFSVFLLTILAGCAGTQSFDKQLLISCRAYASALNQLAVMNAAGNLSEEDVKTVEFWRPTLNMMCDPEFRPENPNQALATLEDGVFILVQMSE